MQRNTTRRYGRYFLVGFALAGRVAADAPAAPAPRRLALTECVTHAVRHNLGLVAAGYEPKLAAEDLVLARAAYGTDLKFEAEASEQQSSSAASELEGSSQPTSEEQNLTASASHKLITGTTLGVSAGLVRSETDSEYATLNPAYDADLTVNVAQPLLRGGGLAANRATLRVRELGVAHADQVMRRRLMDVVRDTAVAYWDLAQAMGEREVRERSLAMSEELLVQTRKKEKAGTAAAVHVLQAEAAVAAKREAIILATQRVGDRRDALLLLMGVSDTDMLAGITVEPPGPVAGAAPDPAASLGAAKQHEPGYLAALGELERRRTELRVAKNERLPSLALSGAFGLSGTDASESDAFDSALTGDGYRWEVGLTLNVPWGLRAENARLRKAAYRVEQAKAELAQRARALRRDVQTACRGVDATIARVRVTRTARELAEKHHAQEQATFDAGLARSRDVLDAQRDLDAARMSELSARVDARKAHARLRRFEGTILSAYGLEGTEDERHPAGL